MRSAGCRVWSGPEVGRRCPERCFRPSIRTCSTGLRRGSRWEAPSFLRRMGRRPRRLWQHGSSRPGLGLHTTLRARICARESRPRSWRPGMRSWACSRWTRPPCRRSRTGSGRARSAWATCFATSSTVTASSSTWQSAGAESCTGSARTLCSWSTAMTRRSETCHGSGRAPSSSAWTTRARLFRSFCTRPIRSGACAAGSRTSTRRSTSGISATTGALHAGTPVRRWMSSLATSNCAASRVSTSRSRPAERRAAWRSPYRASTTSTTRSRRRRSLSRSAPRSTRSSPGWPASARHSGASNGSSSATRPCSCSS